MKTIPITKAEIFALREKSSGAWTKASLALIGVKYPISKGWIERTVASGVPADCVWAARKAKGWSRLSPSLECKKTNVDPVEHCSTRHPAWRPDRPAPQAVHDQFKRGEITEADYRWLIGKNDDEHEQNECRHRRNKRERGGWVR